jgi:hypothetical protein
LVNEPSSQLTEPHEAYACQSKSEKCEIAETQLRLRARKALDIATSRPEAKGFQHLQRSYERYLALAPAEAQNGNTVAAENYYQHAEHYLRSMSSKES